MLSLHWRKVAIVLVAVCYSTVSEAQHFRKNENYEAYSKKAFYFGISLGFNSSKHQVFHSRDFIGHPRIFSAQGSAGPGFNVHGIINYKFGEYFDFRSLPGFTFGTRYLDFNELDPNTSELSRNRETVESIFAELPFHIRYKSAPYKDKRAFVIAGINYSYDVSSNSETRQADDFIKISPHDFQLEAGFGMQFFMPYFIFSPEIKFSHGITNTLIFSETLEQSSVMEKLLSRVFTLSFHFEG